MKNNDTKKLFLFKAAKKSEVGFALKIVHETSNENMRTLCDPRNQKFKQELPRLTSARSLKQKETSTVQLSKQTNWVFLITKKVNIHSAKLSENYVDRNLCKTI